MSQSIDATDIYGNETMNTFLYIIQRNLQIIYYYKNIMDEWK